MKNPDMPLFSNTCGKLFNDNVVFASVNRENSFPVKDIKKIYFVKSIVWSNLWFMLVPISILALSRLVSDNDTFVKIFMYSIAWVFMLITLIKVEKKYTIKISLKDGSLHAIRASKDNVTDAQKFIGNATKLIKEQHILARTTTVAAKKEAAVFSKSVTTIIHH